MEGSAFKIVRLYDAQKAHETGNGYYTKSYNLKNEHYIEDLKQDRVIQRQKNVQFKTALKNKEYVLPKDPAIVENIEKRLLDPQDEVQSLNSLKLNKARLQARSHQLATPTMDEVQRMRTEFKLKLDSGTGNTILIFGSSKSGKSTVLMHIYDKYFAPENDKPKNNEYINTLWTNSPNISLYKGHNGLIIGNRFDKSAENIIKMEKKINTKTDNKYKFLNIFDDCIEVRNMKLINNGMLFYRNSNMSQIVSLQYSNLMSKMSRANTHNLLAFNMLSDEATEVIVKTYFTGIFKELGLVNLEDMKSFYKHVTADHGFIYFRPQDNTISFHKIRI